MDSPFFNSRWNSFAQPRYYEFQPPTAEASRPAERPQASRSPKVVSIPVRFVDSSQPDRPESALKIQKVFRGLRVRRSVKKILAIKREVDEIERTISGPEVVEMLRRDHRERLRVNETLMNLLLRLDSVRGVDADVRECRKAVIRRAIALQEKVDAIVAVDAAVDQPAIEAAEEKVDAIVNVDAEVDQSETKAAERDGAADNGSSMNIELVVASAETEQLQSDAPKKSDVTMDDDRHDDADQTMGETGEVSDPNQAERLEESAREADHLGEGENQCLMMDEREDGEYVEISERGVHEIERNEKLDLEIETKEDDNVQVVADSKSEFCCDDDEDLEQLSGEDAMMSSPGEETQTESRADSSQSFVKGVEENQDDGAAEEPQEHESDKIKEEKGSEEERSRRKKELLEQMVEDNEKMMHLMADLFQRNEQQTRLLATLSQRVEQLERAFVCEKLRRKKKRLAGGQH